jgi:AMP deaminase
VKQRWLGPNYLIEGIASNDINQTNIPDIRITFRYETLVQELGIIFETAQGLADKASAAV